MRRAPGLAPAPGIFDTYKANCIEVGRSPKPHNALDLYKRPLKGVIPVKADQAANRKKRGAHGGREYAFDPVLYRDRNTVERCINKLKSWRGIATRYDKTPESYSAGLHLCGSIIWLHSLRPTT